MSQDQIIYLKVGDISSYLTDAFSIQNLIYRGRIINTHNLIIDEQLRAIFTRLSDSDWDGNVIQFHTQKHYR